MTQTAILQNTLKLWREQPSYRMLAFLGLYHQAQASEDFSQPIRVTICVSMIDSVCPWTYSSGDPIKNLVVCLSVLEPTACHVGQNCFGYSTSSELTVLVSFPLDDYVSYSTSSELTVLVTFRILPRRRVDCFGYVSYSTSSSRWLFWLRFVFYLVVALTNWSWRVYHADANT